MGKMGACDRLGLVAGPFAIRIGSSRPQAAHIQEQQAYDTGSGNVSHGFPPTPKNNIAEEGKRRQTEPVLTGQAA